MGAPQANRLHGKRCITCPDGGYCPGGTGISGVRAMVGYWRVPNTTIFVPCLNPCSCLGSINPSMHVQKQKYITTRAATFKKAINKDLDYVLDVVLGFLGTDVARAKDAITQ